MGCRRDIAGQKHKPPCAKLLVDLKISQKGLMMCVSFQAKKRVFFSGSFSTSWTSNVLQSQGVSALPG